MGTRSLTIVVHDGDMRMSQYNHSDSYPRGLGQELAHLIQKTPIRKLRKAMEKTTLVPPEFYESKEEEEIPYPFLDRDYSGAQAIEKILEHADRYDEITLEDNLDFAANSIWNEWTYLIDLDNKIVSVYQGGNTTPLTEEDCFYFLQKGGMKASSDSDEIFYPVRLYKRYDLRDFTPRAMTALQKQTEREFDEFRSFKPQVP